MNLLFIFTGGTIGSAVSGDYIAADENIPYELLKIYRKRYGLEHSYDIITPYTELSEQNTGATISKLVECVWDVVDGAGVGEPADADKEPYRKEYAHSNCEHFDKRDGGSAKYDGIIVTHGTDTLPYSAAALSYALGNDCVPICIVSSNYPINDERANGVDNLHGAIRLIESGYHIAPDDGTGNDRDETSGIHRGVFVPYRNNDGVTYIHRASRVLETSAFSDEYYSVRNEFYGQIIDGCFQKNDSYKEGADAFAPMGKVALADICDSIKRYKLYPGISFKEAEEQYMMAGERRCEFQDHCILLEGFHSGTMNTKLEDYRRFFELMHRYGVPVYLTGIRQGISYESTSLYGRLNIQPVYDIAPAAVFMKLWMLKAAGREWSADILGQSLGGDV